MTLFRAEKSGETRVQTIRRLKRDVALVVVLKTVLIVTAALTIFGASHRVHVNTDVMANQLMR